MATSPTSGPGGSGGTFNGGTITEPLIIDGSAQAHGVTMLEVTPPTNADGTFLKLDAGGFGGIPGLDLIGDGAGSVDDFLLSSEATGGIDTPDLTLGRGGSGTNIQLQAAGIAMNQSVMVFNRKTVPADSDLTNSSFAFWLDDTPGVGNTKLMVKAKDSAGTVRTAAIVLA